MDLPLLFLLSLQVFNLAFFVRASDPVPCPFNSDECLCIPSTYEPNAFSIVTCESKTSSPVQFFSNSTTDKFDVENSLTIIGNVADLPPRYLEAFGNIVFLELRSDVRRSQNWDPATFDGCDIVGLNISGLTGIIPPPMAFRRLGDSGLMDLAISDANPEGVTLEDNAFQNFTKIRWFDMERTILTKISNKAFAGLGSSSVSMLDMSFDHTSFPGDQLPTDALANLNLRRLDLDSTGIRRFPQGTFSNFKWLQSLSVENEDMSQSVDSGDFDQLPRRFTDIMFINCSLTEVPKRIMDNHPRLESLNLLSNRIEAIKADDFENAKNVGTLTLDYNPITSIEQGAFSTLERASFIFLNDISEIQSIDMALFDGAGLQPGIGLLGCTGLTKVYVSDLENFPDDAMVSISPSLRTIDPSLQQLFDKYQYVILDISDNTNLQCDHDLDWIAPYICDQHVQFNVTSTMCDSGQHLTDYLHSVGGPCGTTTAAAVPVRRAKKKNPEARKRKIRVV